MPVKASVIISSGVSANHTDCEETGWIIVCAIDEEDDEQVPCKSVYDKRFANVNSCIAKKLWMLRVRLNQEESGLIPYNETEESILFKDQVAE